MSTFEDFLRPIPARVPTGEPTLDALLARVEEADDPETVAALSRAPNAGHALAARLTEVAGSIANLSLASTAERPVYEAVFAAQRERWRLVRDLATAAGAHGAEDLLLRLFTSHPDPGVRLAVGRALLAAKPSARTLEAMVPAMDLDDGHMVWVRDVGTAAAVQLDPSTAFDRLSARFALERAKPHSYLARGLFIALHANAPIDPRWFPFVLPFFETGDAVVLDSVLRAHPVPEAVSALATFVRERARAGQPWNSQAGYTLEIWGPRGRAAAPAVVEAAHAALRAGKTDYNLGKPLDVLVAMNDPAIVPALRALLPDAKRRAKTMLNAALTKLGAELAPARRRARTKTEQA